MFRSERMSATSIICVKQDVESVLQALSSFGEFHIETATEDASLTEYNENIQKTEESLSNVNGLIKYLCQEKPGLFDMFKVSQPTRTRVTAENWQALSEATNQQISTLKKEFDELYTAMSSVKEKTAHLNLVKEMLTTLDAMKVDLEALEELKLIHVSVATIPHKNIEALKTALADFSVVINFSPLPSKNDFVSVAVPSNQGAEVEKILKLHRAETFVIPKDLPHNAAQALNEVNNRLKENIKKEKTFSDALENLGKENKDKLVAWKENTENTLALLNAKKKILQSGRLATLKGFVPQKKFSELNEKVHGMLHEKVLVLENEVPAAADPPTKISHGRFIRPFEELTKLYGLPHYSEVDPTPIIAITYPILFGLMFGDVGHGLVLLIGGLLLGKFVKRNQGIKNISLIMAACGVGAIAAGLLFGEFFGFQLFAPLWFSPFENVLSFLIFTLIVGVAQILTGIVLEMVNFGLKHEFVNAIFTSVPKIAFYLGGVALIAVYQLNFGAWLNGAILWPLIPFVILVAGKPIFLAATKMSQRPEKDLESVAGETFEHPELDTFSGRLFEGGDLVTRLLSNTMSYSRILALLMAHWALLLVTYTIAGLVGTASILTLIVGGIIIVFGNIFVLALEGLIVFIHTLRLHFYEWFSKFYQGSGTEFTPYKQNHVYTEVVLEEKKV